jgi:hypothetical protein
VALIRGILDLSKSIKKTLLDAQFDYVDTRIDAT